MIEIVVKVILVSFILFYVIDFSLHSISESKKIPFSTLRGYYHNSKIYGFIRSTGIWGGAGMFCPGTRVRYYHYAIKNGKGKVIFAFPNFTKLPYPLQIWYFRWRRLGYCGIQNKEKFIRNFARFHGVRNTFKLHETIYISPYMDYDGTIVPGKIRRHVTKWPPKKLEEAVNKSKQEKVTDDRRN